MANGDVTVRIDWTRSGSFSGLYDEVRVPMAIDIRRGLNGDFSGEALGAASLVFENDDEFFTPDRQWADNPSFEYGTTGWTATAITGLIAAGTSISQVTDNAGQGGTKAGEAVLTSTSGSGVTFKLPWRFRSGVQYAFRFYIKSSSGTLSVQVGIASSGTVADIATAAGTITTSWVAYSGTWTPSSDRTDAVLFVRTTTASAATVRIDNISLNAGSAINTYVEGPTRAQLGPGKPVHIMGEYNSTDYAKFFGYIERIVPDSRSRTVQIECYDVLSRMNEVEVIVPETDLYTRTGRDMRIEVLSDFERGNVNLAGHNPSFETNTTGWTQTGTSLTRVTTDFAPGGGTCCAEFISGAANAEAYIKARFIPHPFEGQTYTFSIYARTTSGSATWTLVMGVNEPEGPDVVTRTVTVTTTWQRFSISFTTPTSISADDDLFGGVQSTASATIRIDNAAITRGALYPYAAVGTGRYPNFIVNGGFDGGTEGWSEAFKNLIGNPSFETNTTGWSTAFSNLAGPGGGSFSRITTKSEWGSASGEIPGGGTVWYGITGTFLAGVTYDFGAWVATTIGSQSFQLGIGSNGTTSDKSLLSTGDTATFSEKHGTWTPVANRSDVQFYFIANAAAHQIDGCYVMRRGTGVTTYPRYVDVGPGTTGGVAPTSFAQSTAQVLYGTSSLAVVTPATATAGVLYDFSDFGPVFTAGQPYTLVMQLRPTSSMAYKIGISADKEDGTYENGTTTGTATANTWNEISVTWTPTVDYLAQTEFAAVVFVWQTDATARTFYLDGVRLIPGSSTDEFEMTHWDLPDAGEATDEYAPTATLSGSALAALSQLNQLTFTRHWIRPTTASPWYAYVAEDRVTFTARTSEATFDGDDLIGNVGFVIDRAGLANIVAVEYGGTETLTSYYGDGDSLELYGERPGATIGGTIFFPDRTVPDLVGPAFIERYRTPRTRPVVVRVNDYANAVTRDLNDVVTVNADRPLVKDDFVIVSEEIRIVAPRNWTVTYTLESFPY